MFHDGACLDTHAALLHNLSELMLKRAMESAIHNF
jgi:hypothetical protein